MSIYQTAVRLISRHPSVPAFFLYAAVASLPLIFVVIASIVEETWLIDIRVC